MGGLCGSLTKAPGPAHSTSIKPLMANFIIDVPVPSMGATVSELTVITIKTKPGERVSKGQKIAELESDKSIFEYEAPADGLVVALPAKPGEVLQSGALFLRLETDDVSLRHLESKAVDSLTSAAAPASPTKPAAALVWTPRATKLAQEAGLDPLNLTDITATGPGGRVSGDDVAAYLAARKS
jgi:pyruvate/2-oxoglutarate dehydrogenase complex dihydrolipoamide acyltransferase (E2) component